MIRIYNLISFLFIQYRAGNLSLNIVDERYIYKIINNITNVLEKINYKLVQAEDGYFNIIEKDASTTAVAELYSDISANVIEYRRYNLKGNLERKKEILYNLSNKFEPIRATLKANNFSEIEDKTGDLLNNLDIRHNNKSGKNAKDIVKNMSNEELEQWYDKTYDLLLMCFMFNNYLSFRDDIKDLNKNLKNRKALFDVKCSKTLIDELDKLNNKISSGKKSIFGGKLSELDIKNLKIDSVLNHGTDHLYEIGEAFRNT